MLIYDFENFVNGWRSQFARLKHILKYLHTYPDILSKLHFDSLIKPEELDSYQEDWVRSVSKYEGLEKDFFIPYWVPISTDALEYFL